MDKSLEDLLFGAVSENDKEKVTQMLHKGANPNKTTRHGKTCLGQAAILGHVTVLKLLIDRTKENPSNIKSYLKKNGHDRSHKRKIRHNGQETVVKYKNLNDRHVKDIHSGSSRNVKPDSQNQGYFVFIHSDASSSDESRVTNNKTSPTSSSSLTPSPQGDLEWDEDLGNFAPTTTEDETWSSMYKWYASILESTGAALASAAMVTSGVDQQDAFMRTALHYAAEQGHTAAVKLLLESGCKVDVSTADGLTPLHVTVIKNNEEIARMLIKSGSHVNYKTHEKMTPLHFAATHGYLDLVKVLVNSGANLEARDTNERTALYLASGRGHLDIVKYLVSVGANVNSEEIHGYTPLCEAVWQRFSLVVEALLSSGARITHSHKLLHNAILHREEDIVKMLAFIGGGINLHNDNGDNPLLLAARLGQTILAKILLENGANVNSCNSITGANALHIAVESVDSPNEFEKLLICLLDYGIDMDAIALTGDTALNRALLLHKDSAAILLIRYGADVNSCDLHSCGVDNLAIASRRRSPDLALMLVLAGHYLSPSESNANLVSGSTKHLLHTLSRQPLSLSEICRIKIRLQCKKKKLHKYLPSLPLPSSLKRYLMIQEITLSVGRSI